MGRGFRWHEHRVGAALFETKKGKTRGLIEREGGWQNLDKKRAELRGLQKGLAAGQLLEQIVKVGARRKGTLKFLRP